jgi:hypothetical protein
MNDDVPMSIDIHRMAHHSVVNSIQMVYKEWFEGWDGRPSISSLLEKSSYAWRSPQDKKVFSRRHKIIRHIQKLVAQGATTESAISLMEERRNKMAISSFADTIKL